MIEMPRPSIDRRLKSINRRTSYVVHVCSDCHKAKMRRSPLSKRWICRNCNSIFDEKDCLYKMVICPEHGLYTDISRMNKCPKCQSKKILEGEISCKIAQNIY